MATDEDRRIPYRPTRRDPADMERRAAEFYAEMETRRSVRKFSSDPVSRRLIELAIRTASTAPSGAHQQPWTFVAVGDADTKRHIRIAAEAEERRSYESRMSAEWLDALSALGTDWKKSFIEDAPWLVVLFEQIHGTFPDGSHRKHYYARESVGIAAGIFVTAVHHMGLATLTHTPSPMGFLTQILGRPRSERPFVLFPVGFPAEDATVPDLRRKGLDEIAVFDPHLDDQDDQEPVPAREAWGGRWLSQAPPMQRHMNGSGADIPCRPWRSRGSASLGHTPARSRRR